MKTTNRKGMNTKKYKTVAFVLVSFSLLIPFWGIAQAQNVNLKAEVVVIGCGGSGLAAAVTAAEGGAKVLVFEKMSSLGGTTNYSEGIFAVESSLQREKNINLTRDQAFKEHMEKTHWSADGRLVRAIINKSASTIDWLQEVGVEFIGPANLYPGGHATWHVIKGFGASMIRALHTKAKELGVQIYIQTPAKRLLMEKSSVVGVIAEGKDGNSIHVNTKAVIIATGGFANNKEMLKKYTNAGPNLKPVGNKGKTGDGIQMAWEVGAAPEATHVLQRMDPGILGGRAFSELMAVLTQPYLWVNQLGERFCDEGIFQFPHVGNAQARQKDGIMYIIFDEKTKNYMIEKGIDLGVGSFLPKGTKLVKLESDLRWAIDKKEAFISDSIDELAGKIGIDRERLVSTLEEYNKFCRQGHDDIFAKNPEFLKPVSIPKFYAIRGYPQFIGTLGGIKINYKTEVLNRENEVIPGLYAAGNCAAGGMYSYTYDASLTGGTLAFAINSGRIAGENALKYLGK